MDFTKNTNLSIEEISENKTSGNELSVTKISDSTAEKTFTNNAFSHFVTDTMTLPIRAVGCFAVLATVPY